MSHQQQPPPSSSETKHTFRVAIVGGGISGACVASILASLPASKNEPTSSTSHNLEPQASQDYKDWFRTNNVRVKVHLFDQGRSGVGGRSSHRVARKNDTDEWLGQWDHGCQVRTHKHNEIRRTSSNYSWEILFPNHHAL